MVKKEWEIIEAAFEKAIALDGKACEAMLVEFSATHPELLQQLEGLLAADREGDGKLRKPIANAARTISEQAVDPWENRKIGVWTIKRRIADGGMGVVFLAERSDAQYQQTAAMKIMTAQLLASDAVVRFRAERQILASLNHPNIAKLIDGGSTVEQLPYLVMEFIDGLPIDRYCDQKKLSISARLALFSKVCKAVDYAHRNLIVHRDLKPNNILVDQDGEPKLLDFGIAKLLESSSTKQTVAVTREGTLLMTPEYASPEQVRGESPTITTDVYALGVLLYRMLTGQSPYGDQVISKHDMECAIISSVPKRPSTVITLADAAGRSATPAVLQKKLSGDLDNIVLKALQKEPARRYATATALADDINNYLTHRPVTARADSYAYRTAKFVRRNLLPLAVASVFLLALVAMSSFYTIRVTEERDAATTESRKANEISAFLVSLFTSASPETMRQPFDDFSEVTAREILDFGLIELRGDTTVDPLVRASLLAVLSRVYERLDDLENAERLSREAIEVMNGAVDAGVATETALSDDFCDALATLATIQRDRDEYTEATEQNERCMSILVASGQATSLRMAYALSRLARISANLGHFKDAEEQLLRASSMIASINGEQSIDYVHSLEDLATLMTRVRRDTEAVGYYQRSLAIARQLVGEQHPTVSLIKQNLATSLTRYRSREPQLALRLMQEALETDLKLFGGTHFRTARAYSNLAFIFSSMSDYDSAIRNSLASISILEKIRGPLYRPALSERVRLARSYYSSGDFETAEEYLLQSISDLQQVDPSDESGNLGLALSTMGSIREDQARYKEAEQYYRDGLARFEHRFGATSRQALAMRENVIWAIGPQGRVDEGDTMYRELLQIARKKYSPADLQEIGRMAETHAEWLDEVQRPALARAVREKWAEEIAAADALIEVLKTEEQERFDNAEREQNLGP